MWNIHGIFFPTQNCGEIPVKADHSTSFHPSSRKKNCCVIQETRRSQGASLDLGFLRGKSMMTWCTTPFCLASCKNHPGKSPAAELSAKLMAILDRYGPPVEGLMNRTCWTPGWFFACPEPNFFGTRSYSSVEQLQVNQCFKLFGLFGLEHAFSTLWQPTLVVHDLKQAMFLLSSTGSVFPPKPRPWALPCSHGVFHPLMFLAIPSVDTPKDLQTSLKFHYKSSQLYWLNGGFLSHGGIRIHGDQVIAERLVVFRGMSWPCRWPGVVCMVRIELCQTWINKRLG